MDLNFVQVGSAAGKRSPAECIQQPAGQGEGSAHSQQRQVVLFNGFDFQHVIPIENGVFKAIKQCGQLLYIFRIEKAVNPFVSSSGFQILPSTQSTTDPSHSLNIVCFRPSINTLITSFLMYTMKNNYPLCYKRGAVQKPVFEQSFSAVYQV